VEVEPRIEERSAVEVLRRQLGVTFTDFDDNRVTGLADGLFVPPDAI
jgi:hypothetical protein